MDNKKYKEWKSEYNLEDRKIKRNLSPEELKEAEREQEVIQRVTKLINNQAEEYSENMETSVSNSYNRLTGSPLSRPAAGSAAERLRHA